jgi:hypothetical protein
MSRRVERILRGRRRSPRTGARRRCLGGHLPRHRRTPAARVRRPHRARPRLQHPRPAGLGRPDEPGAPRARAVGEEASASRRRAPAWRSTRRWSTRAPRSARCCRRAFPWCASGRTSSSACSAPTSSQAGAAGARLRRPAALLGADGRRCRSSAPRSAAASPRAGRRVPGHQRAAGGDPAGDETRWPRPHRGRRRRAVDLRLSAAPRCATSSISRRHFAPPAQVVTLDRNYRSTQPILDAANQVIALAAERFTKDLWSERASAKAAAGLGARRRRPGRDYVVDRCSRAARPASSSSSRRCCSGPRRTACAWNSS